jgi:cyclopropane fatty-acyl-phospholipid synthase-like methyltransferase
MTTRDQRDALAHFRERYAMPTIPVVDEIEAQVIGATWGANGYTTLDQADELARRLGLGAGVRLLDVGTGRGWPGVYFAVRYVCEVAGTDMPFDAVAAASARAGREGVAGRYVAVAAAGVQQPFRPAVFDAVVHTDVLC